MQDKHKDKSNYDDIVLKGATVSEEIVGTIDVDKKPPAPPKAVILIIFTLVIVGVIALLLVLVPFIIIGSLANGCDKKSKELESTSNKVYSKLQSIEGAKDIDAYPNGDCLTGTGTNFNFTNKLPYANSNVAIETTLKKLKEAGFPTLLPSENPDISARNEYDSGGNISIKQIDVKYNNYSFNIELDSPLNCEVKQELNAVYCNGTEKQFLLKQILETQPVDKIKASGYIYSI